MTKKEEPKPSIDELADRISGGLKYWEEHPKEFAKHGDRFRALVRQFLDLWAEGVGLEKTWNQMEKDEPKEYSPTPLKKDAGHAEYRCPRCGRALKKDQGKQYAWGGMQPTRICAGCYDWLQGSRLPFKWSLNEEYQSSQ